MSAEMAVFGGSGQDSNSSEDGSHQVTPSSGTSQPTASPLIAAPNCDDLLEPIERLEKYSISDVIFHRQVAARSVLETLHEVRLIESELKRVATVILRFSADSEPSIKAELAEQLPHISSFCVNQISLPEMMTTCVLPTLEKFLTDNNSQVRKITQNSLAFMLEQNFVTVDFIEERVSPVLVHLMDVTNLDDYRIEAVTTVSKIIRYIGKNATERIFLEHFSRLCTDVSFHVRRVCAANFGEFCTVVGQELTETFLLAQFKSLCEDGIWGVRKACADVFVPVSCICSNQVRRKVLGPLFVSLLRDPSKWVKTAAFQALGPFISTFADPKKTGLYYNDSGVIVIDDMNISDSSENNCDTTLTSAQDESVETDEQSLPSYVNNMSLNEFALNSTPLAGNNDEIIASQDNSQSVDSKLQSEFNSFQYWRLPLLDVPIELELNVAPVINYEMQLTGHDSICEDTEMRDEQMLQCIVNNSSKTSAINVQSFNSSKDNNSSVISNDSAFNSIYTSIFEQDHSKKGNQFLDKDKIPSPYESFFYSTNLGDDFLSHTFGETSHARTLEGLSYDSTNCIAQFRKVPLDQNIIPNELLEHYLSMTNPLTYQSVDQDLTHHCAYSLPAVALTLGRKNWPCLKETYEVLATDMQWKVRWTLASSLHQMALILGPEFTTRDLLPVFVSFMKDLDEVRFGILQNLAAILRLLNAPEQMAILPKIAEFLKMDNSRNWRFRFCLSEQIAEIASLYQPAEIKEHLLPIAFILLKDRVSQVRLGAIRLLSTLTKIFCNSLTTDAPLLEQMIQELIAEVTAFVSSSKWIFRQAFIMLCEQFLVDNALPQKLFLEHFFQNMLSLSTDNVPNVRLALSRCISRTYSINEIITFQKDDILHTLKYLKNDTDSDVRRFAYLVTYNESAGFSELHTLSTKSPEKYDMTEPNF